MGVKTNLNTGDPCGECIEYTVPVLGVCDLADLPEMNPPENFGLVVREKFIAENECCEEVPYCRGAVIPYNKLLDALCVKDMLFDANYRINSLLTYTDADLPGPAIDQTDTIILTGQVSIPTCATHAIIKVTSQAYTYNATAGVSKICSGGGNFMGSYLQISGAIVGNTNSEPLDLTRDTDSSFFYVDIDNGASIDLRTFAQNLDGAQEGWAVNYDLVGFLAASVT